MQLRAERDAEEFLGHCLILMSICPDTFVKSNVGDTRLWWKRLYLIVDRTGLKAMWRSECGSFVSATPFYEESGNKIHNISAIRYVLPSLREATLLDRLAEL